MPEKTADDLARILSLASSNAPRVRPNSDAGVAGPASGPAPSVPGPMYRDGGNESGGSQREFSPGLMSSLFYDFGAPSSLGDAAATARTRFDSKTSEGADEGSNWITSYNHHLLDPVGAAAAAPDDGLSAMGPHTYGAFHIDPIGPADRETEMGPSGPPMHLSDGFPSSPTILETDVAAGPAAGAGLDLETSSPGSPRLSQLGGSAGSNLLSGWLLRPGAPDVSQGMRFGAHTSLDSLEFRYMGLKREKFVESHSDRYHTTGSLAKGEEKEMRSEVRAPEISATGKLQGKELKGKERELRRTDTGRAGARTSVLTEDQAVEVFKLRPAQRSERASLCAELAERYGVTTTAIRHIWDRRTWVWTNMPHWTEAEMAASLSEGVCDTCRKNKINKIEDTCGDCPLNRKRGRPRGARDTYRRQRKANGSATPVHRGAPASLH